MLCVPDNMTKKSHIINARKNKLKIKHYDHWFPMKNKEFHIFILPVLKLFIIVNGPRIYAYRINIRRIKDIAHR